MKLNKILTSVLVSALLLGASSCNTDTLKGLDNPKYLLTPENADMSMLFTNIGVNHIKRTASRASLMDQGTLMKYYTASGLLATYGLTYDVTAANQNLWTPYQNELKWAITLEDFLTQQNDASQVNNLALTKILKVAIAARMTDAYGDIPYSQAGRAYIDGADSYFPAYDKQSELYPKLLAELDEAISSINASATGNWASSRDLIYKMNLTKWKKYGYSLMLRMAMRLSNVSASTAKQYAEKAVAGGVIEDNTDNFWLKAGETGVTAERNPYSQYFNGNGGGDPEHYTRMGQYWIQQLQDNADPRRFALYGGLGQPSITITSNAHIQSLERQYDAWLWEMDGTPAKGHPHDNSSYSQNEAYHNWTSPNFFFWTVDLPIYELTASEMWLLRAEMALKGWNAGTTAATAYEKGIKTFAELLNSAPSLRDNMKSTSADVDTYIASRPVSLDNVKYELWVTLYMNPWESYCHARRVNLAIPTNVPGKQMPRRLCYPADERTVNPENLHVALQAMGISEDVMPEVEAACRVWWDTL